jgi:hypothetical protein
LILGPKNLEKLQKTLEKEREKRRDVTQTKEELFGRPPRCCMQLTLKIYRCPAKTASKSLLEMLQKHQFLLQKFLCIHRKFPAKIYDMKI